MDVCLLLGSGGVFFGVSSFGSNKTESLFLCLNVCLLLDSSGI
jgi:hypothetical protein